MDVSNLVCHKKPKHEVPVIGTHNGTFHCDEVLACFLLKQLPELENATIIRSRENDLSSKCDILVDVGDKFDVGKQLFDHHQKGFEETLYSVKPEYGEEFNKIRLSSAGLIYAFYGERAIKTILKKRKNVEIADKQLKLVYKQLYKNFISEVDAIDNGIPMFNGGEPLYNISTHLSNRVSRLNPSWDTDQTSYNADEAFMLAMELVGNEFIDQVIALGVSWVNARDIVERAILNSKSIYHTGEILVLEKFCPWKQHLMDLEKQYNIEGLIKQVIFSERLDSWRVQGMSVTPTSFVGRKYLPEEWRGLRYAELSTKAGIADLLFVHHSGFFGGAKTKDAALEMAIKSVEW